MSRQDDLRFLQDEILGKQGQIKFSSDFNDLDKLANGSFMFIVLQKGVCLLRAQLITPYSTHLMTK